MKRSYADVGATPWFEFIGESIRFDPYASALPVAKGRALRRRRDDDSATRRCYAAGNLTCDTDLYSKSRASSLILAQSSGSRSEPPAQVNVDRQKCAIVAESHFGRRSIRAIGRSSSPWGSGGVGQRATASASPGRSEERRV